MTTTTSDGPPNDEEKGGNVGKLWAHATIFFAIKRKTIIKMCKNVPSLVFVIGHGILAGKYIAKYHDSLI